MSEFDQCPLDRSIVAQDRLDLVGRYRTSLLPWRGQFSPEFIELLLDTFSGSDTVVADPFVGSGTTLFECAHRSLACYGSEINPAAVAMASNVEFVNLSMGERENHMRHAQEIMERHFTLKIGGLFSEIEKSHEHESYVSPDSLLAMLEDASCERLVQTLMVNTVMRFMSSDRERSANALFLAFEDHKKLVRRLPYSPKRYRLFHCDARALPLADNAVDLILTSPPYINVFNYHQNSRQAMELMGWNILGVARSEFGSNRKNRGNRFLTVVQYTIDMVQALLEMRRLIRSDGRIIVVVGRESNVRGTSFRNGRIVAALATGGASLRLDLRQERKFKTKFGATIYEDILHFVPSSEGPAHPEIFARHLAQHVLSEAATRTSEEVRTDIVEAIRKASAVSPSPYFAANGYES